MTQGKGRGRPALKDGAARTSYVTFRVSAGERRELERAAERSNTLLTQWARGTLLEIAQKRK